MFLRYIILIVFLIIQHYQCESEHIFKYLEEFVDLKENPCNNFYQYTCGTWLKENELKENENKISVIATINKKYEKFLEEAKKGVYDNDSPAIKKINEIRGKCESTCFNVTFENVILKGFGNYPYVSYFLKKEFSLNEQNIQKYNIAYKIFSDVKNEFRLLIDEKDEMLDQTTKENSIKKIEHMKVETSYIANFMNSTLIEECYQHLDTTKDDSEDVIISKINNFYKLLNETNDVYLSNCFSFMFNGALLNMVTQINAAYFNFGNFIFASPMLLNEPLFSPDFPMSLNYGSVGFILAHEILHGFDKSRIKYDYKGKFNPSTTNEEKMKKYLEKSKCFANQYSNVVYEKIGKNINGTLTLDENIADNGAIKLAHRAYLKYLKSVGGKEEKTKDFDAYTDEQLFFIGFGKTLCEKVTFEHGKKRLETDIHSPSDIRVNKPLSNYEPFSKTFGCSVGDNMNPPNKCELWRN